MVAIPANAKPPEWGYVMVRAKPKLKPTQNVRASEPVKPRKLLRATKIVKPKILVRPTDFEEEAKQRKQDWLERMKKQYSSYKHPKLHALISFYYDEEDIRLAYENRFRTVKSLVSLEDSSLEEMTGHFKTLKAHEQSLAKDIEATLANIPVYTEFLSKNKGIGPIYSACLIAWIDDIGRFSTISKLHRYCGLSAINGQAQKKRMGLALDYNPKMKSLLYKIGTSFLMAKNEYYREIYDEAHRYYEERGDFKNKLHLKYRAMKKMERIFIANLWLKWRILEGLPVSEPWIFGPGGHDPSHKI